MVRSDEEVLVLTRRVFDGLYEYRRRASAAPGGEEADDDRVPAHRDRAR